MNTSMNIFRLVGLLGVVALAQGQGCSIGSGALCQTCTLGGAGCASCNDGFILSGNACEPCPEACSQCSNSVCRDLPDTACYRYGNWILTVGWEASVNAPLFTTGSFAVTSPEFFSNRNLTFNSATGTLAGTATAPGASFVRVTNSDGFACAIAVRICPSGLSGPMCSCPVSGDPLLTLQPFNPDIADSSPGVTSSSIMELDIILEPNAMNPRFSLATCSTDAVLPWTGAYNNNCQMVYAVQVQYPKCNLSVTTTQDGTMASVSGAVTVSATIPLVQFEGNQEYRTVQSLVSWYFSLPIQLELSQTHFYTNSTRICDTSDNCNTYYCDTSSHTCQCNTAISGWDGPNCLNDVKAPTWSCSDVSVSFTQDPSSPFALQSQTMSGTLPTAADNNPLPLSITGSLSGPSTASVDPTTLFSANLPWWPFLGSAGSWARQVAFYATDAQQNSASCVVNVYFTDVAAPSISCPGSLVTNIAGLVQHRAATVTYSDNTPGCALSMVPDPSSIVSDGKYSVVYTATDTSGNNNTCTSDIVYDTVAPVITCVTSLSVNTNTDSASYSLVLSDIAASTPPPDANAASLVDAIINSAQWAPGVQLTLSQEGSRTFTSTFAQSDAAGNIGSCVSTITVTDNESPSVSCGASFTQDVGTDSNTATFVSASSADNVGVSTLDISAVTPLSGPNGLANPLSSYSNLDYNASGAARTGGFVTLGVGVWSVSIRVQDYNSNVNTCATQITITDTQAPDPSAVCAAIPVTMTLGLTNTLPFSAPQVSASDNQPASASLAVSYTLTHSGPDTSFTTPLTNLGEIPWGSNEIQVQATDASGNTATCSQVVQVEDHTVPTIHVGGYATTLQFNTASDTNTVELAYSLTAITQLSGEAKTVPLVTWDNVQLGQVTGNRTTFPIGTTALNLSVTDCAACSGLVGTCSVSIQVVDAVLPVVHCPSDVSINAGSNQPFASIGWTVNATDNDQVAQLIIAEDYLSSITINAASFTQAPINYRVGTHTFVVTALDASLNSQTCTFVLTVLPACGDGLVTGTEECDGGEGCHACVCDSAHNYLPSVNHALDKDIVSSFSPFSQFNQPISGTTASEFAVVIGLAATPLSSLAIYVGNVEVFELGLALEAHSILTVQVTAGCSVTIFVNGDQVEASKVLPSCSSLQLQNNLGVTAEVELASLRVVRRALTLDEIDTIADSALQQPRANACARRTDVNTPCAQVANVTFCANFSAVVSATEPIQTPDCSVVADEGFYVDFGATGSGLVTLCDLPERPSLFLVDFTLTTPSFSTLFGCPAGVTPRTYDVPTDCWQFPVCTPGYYTTGVVAAECPSYIACDSDTLYTSVTQGNDAGVVFDYTQSAVVAPLPTVAVATLTGFGSVPAGISPINSSYASHSVFHVGTYSVVFQAGNATKIDQCAVNVVVLDKTAPVLTCQDGIVSADAGSNTRVLSPSLTSCTDDYSTCASKEFCAGIGCTQWLSEASVFTFPLGNTSVQWRGVDVAGNEGECTQVITVRDTEAPVVTQNYPSTVAAPDTSACANVSLQINRADGYSYTVADNVDDISLLTCVWSVDDTPVSGTVCLPIQPLHELYLVNLSCTDQSGNTGSDVYDLQVSDATPPTCVSLAPVVIMSSAASVSALDIQTQVYSAVASAGWTDNNPSAVNIRVPLPSNAAVPSSQDYPYVVSDGYSTVECRVTVTIEDVGAPVIQCVNETIAPSDDSYRPSTPTVVDNSGVALVATFSKTGSSHYLLGDNEIVWTATDASGNVGTCTSDVFVLDNTPPSITCPSDVVILSSSRVGSCVAGDISSGCCLARSTANPLAFPWSAPIVTDNYQWTAPTVSTIQADLCVARNDTFITYTATDAAGFSTSCQFKVTLHDDSPPTFLSCPSNAVQLTLPVTTTNGTLTYDWGLVVTDDLQASPSLSQVKIDGAAQTSTGLSGTRALVYGDHTFEFQISDATQFSVCSYHVFVSDVTAPVLTCPPNQILRSLSSDNHVNFDPTENHAADSEPDYTGTGTGLVLSDNSFMLNVPTYSTSFPYIGAGQSTTTTISVTDAANNAQSCQYQVTVLPKLASATVDGALSKVTLNRRQDGSLYATLNFLTSVPWPWVLEVATQTDSNLQNVAISGPDDCPAAEFSTPHDSCRQTFSALANLPACYGDISLAVKVLADCYTHGPDAHVGSCSSEVVTLVITLSLGSSDTSSLCLSHNVTTVPITTSLVALSDAQYAQFVSSGSAPVANNIFLDTDYINMVAQVQSVVNTSKVSVVSAWREYCALVCSGNNSISSTDLVKNGVVTAVVEHSENHTQYSVIRFLNNDVPVNTQYYTVLHAVIEIEYSLGGGQRRSTIVQASASQQQAQAQVAGYMLQRGHVDSTANNLPPHTVEISLVLVGDLRPVLADAGCMSEWKSMVSAGLSSKLALLLGQPASRFTVNVDLVQPEGAAITINISPLNGQVDTFLTTQLQTLVANSASLFSIQVSACARNTLTTVSPDVFFMRSANGSPSVPPSTAVSSRSNVKKFVVVGATIGGVVCVIALVVVIVSRRVRKNGTEKPIEETRHGSGGIVYRSVHLEAETVPANNGDETPPVSVEAFREMV